MTSAGLRPLRDALDRAADESRPLGIWWRDDDAVAATPQLDRLLRLAGAAEVPIALAAIPARVEPSLPDRLRVARDVSVLVHGFAHADHAAAGEKPSEFGDGRSETRLGRDLGEARRRIAGAFGTRAADVFVPPWNRIGPAATALLAGSGFSALSAFGGAGGRVRPGLVRVDTHLDPVDWRGTRSLASPEALRAMIDAALGAGSTLLGLLTHHLVFDEALWAWCEEAIDLCAGHPGARFASVSALVEDMSSVRHVPGRWMPGPNPAALPPA